jgi:Ca2+-binding RTX toxin-like protein
VVVSDINSAEDKFYGGRDEDKMWGASGKEVIRGGAGGDTLRAGRGPDHLYGWTGNDLLKAALDDEVQDYLEGGPGHDVCHIRSGDTAVRCEQVIVDGEPVDS